MELSRQLRQVQFRTKGKWYSAEQVDAFLEQITVSVDEEERESDRVRDKNKTLERDLEAARGEIRRLEGELERAKTQENRSAGDRQRDLCRELEEERDRLIQDIKALRRFREEFRSAVKGDGETLLKQIETLDSENLL